MKKWILIAIIILISLPILWYTLSPLFIDKVVDERMPGSSSSSSSNLGSINENSEENEEVSIPPIYQGNFIDADSFHKASGIAKIIPNSNKKYLRFEDFKVTNGPDLYVYLSTDKSNDDFINLGKIKGNIGNQNYEIPEGIDLEKYDNILIWCKAFRVLFGSSELKKIN